MYFEANLHMRVSFLGANFALPRGANFKPKFIREPTTYWGWLEASKSYGYVPYSKPANLPKILHKWLA